jgi:hypothetical protein
MMKKNLLLILMLTVWIKVSCNGQQLTFEIASLTDSTRNKFVNSLGNNLTQLKDWTFKIKNPQKFHVTAKFQNGDNEFKNIEVSNNQNYSIKNNKLILSADSLNIDSKLEISIISHDGISLGKMVLNFKKQTPKPAQPVKDTPYKIGFIYYDAVFLADKDSDPDTKLKILQYYLNENDPEKIASANYGVNDAKIKEILKEIQQQKEREAEKAQQFGLLDKLGSIISSAANTAGNYDVTNIADGIARFLVTRVKEELSIAFFQHFKDVLDKEPTSDLQYLFPTTYDILHSMDKEIYNWDNYITSLREGFDKDISSLVPNLESFEAKASLLERFREKTSNHVSARIALYLAGGFNDQVHAGSMLADFNADEYLQPTDKDLNDTHINWIMLNLRNSVKSLQLFSNSLRSRDTSDFWINEQQLKELMYDDDLFRYYVLLLSLQANKQDIKFQKNESKEEYCYLRDMIADLQTAKPVINGFIVKINNFRSRYAKLKTAIDNAKTDSAKAKISYVDVYPFIQSSIAIMKYSNTSILKLIKNVDAAELKNVFHKTDTVIDILSKAGELGMDVSLKRYSAAIVDITYLINQTRDLIDNGKPADIKEKEDNMRSSIEAMSKEDPENKKIKKAQKMVAEYNSDKITAAGNVNHSVNPTNLAEFTENLIKYGTFMSSVVKANDSKEVEKVIQNFALPTGSSRIKRKSAFNVSLNAYPGIYGGYESIKGVDPQWHLHSFKLNSFGVTAPIGCAISTGQNKFLGFIGKREWSYSLFISAVDLGAVASFRFQNDTVASVPTIQLEDIISPGAFLSIGLPKCPLSLNMGVQIGPNLRKITSSEGNPELTNDYSNSTYLRYSVSLCVDIPILNLVNKTDRKR